MCSRTCSWCGCPEAPCSTASIAFGHSLVGFMTPTAIVYALIVVAGRLHHRRAARPHRHDGRRADDDADHQAAVEPGAADPDLHLRRRDLWRQPQRDPAQHSRHAGLGRVLPRRPRARASRDSPAARWASRPPARCSAPGSACCSSRCFTPVLGEMALKFGAYEFFWLAVFGVVISGNLTGNDPLKGWMAGFLGLFIAGIGQEAHLRVRPLHLRHPRSGRRHLARARAGRRLRLRRGASP